MKTKIQRFYKLISRPLIIKLLFPSLLLLFSFRPGAGTEEPKLPVIQKEMKFNTRFQSVRIDGDISVILTNDPAGTLMAEGSEPTLNNIKFRVKNNELTIDAHKKNHLDKLTIYLSVARLKSMLVNGDANISSADIINSENLQIWLNGITTVKVTSTGKVNVDASDAYELLWESPLHG
jgi:Putative auto-transporter adhesin, head GIN domain